VWRDAARGDAEPRAPSPLIAVGVEPAMLTILAPAGSMARGHQRAELTEELLALAVRLAVEPPAWA